MPDKAKTILKSNHLLETTGIPLFLFPTPPYLDTNLLSRPKQCLSNEITRQSRHLYIDVLLF